MSDINRTLTPEEARLLGWSIIPTGGGPDGKAPIIGSWKRFMNARASDAEFKSWAGRRPKSWAVICGAVSNLVILDFDGAPGVALLESWGLKPHMQTPSGGYHLYIEHPGWPVQTLNHVSKHELGRRFPGLDIRADGGYALFCGSTAKGTYKLLRAPQKLPISAVPRDAAEFLGLIKTENLTPAPSQQQRREKTNTAKQTAPDNRALKGEFDWVRWALERITAYGGRNNAGYQLAGQLRDNGLARPEAEAIMRAYAAACPQTDQHGSTSAYTEAEALATLDSAYRGYSRKAWDTQAKGNQSGRPGNPNTPQQHNTPPANPQHGGDKPKNDEKQAVKRTNRPELWAHWQESQLIEAIWTHLKARNASILESRKVKHNAEPLFLYPGSPCLARLVRRQNSEGDSVIEIELPSVVQVEGLLAREFTWLTEDSKGNPRNRDPKDRACKLVHGDAANAPEHPLEYIHSVGNTPLFAADGALLTASGYHAAERLWLEPADELRAMPEIPEHPDETHMQAAKALILDDLLADFPFTGEAERATAIAALLLPFVRRMIEAPTPLHLIEAPVQGSGKSLLARLIALVAAGGGISPIVLNSNEEETQKALAAELARGRQIIIIDNVETSSHPLNSPALAAIATETTFANRRLGQSEMMELPNRCLWLVTGNNVRLSTDLVRRFIRCRIDPQNERPWLRQATGFRHADITDWSRRNRARLVWACLIICRAWIDGGCRPGSKPLGSYERWSAVIGGILEHAGISGFLDNLDDLYSSNDSDADAWTPFIVAWRERHISMPVTAKQLNTLCAENDLMLASRGDKGEMSQVRRLGRALSNADGRIIAGYRVQCERDQHAKVMLYRLEATPEAAPAEEKAASISSSNFDDDDLFNV